MRVQDLYIYPVKSLGGIRVESIELDRFGFKGDRRWMIVDESGAFVTQREHPELSLVKVSFHNDGYEIVGPGGWFDLPLELKEGPTTEVHVWGDHCEGIIYSDTDGLAAWLSDLIQRPVNLVYMADHIDRQVDPEYAPDQDITSFTDGYPVLMISQESLDDLNTRLAVPVEMERFRPNLVISGAKPYGEDDLKHFAIRDFEGFEGVKLCSRCVITTIDRTTGAKGKEPLITLGKYRTFNNKIYFGQNVLCPAEGIINIGDVVW